MYALLCIVIQVAIIPLNQCTRLNLSLKFTFEQAYKASITEQKIRLGKRRITATAAYRAFIRVVDPQQN
jgi:hypothetical protein